MTISKILRAAAAACLAGLLCGTAFSQGSYPSRPLRLVVPTAAGGPTDFVARLLAIKLGESLGQSVLVENIAGASGVVGTAALIKAPADGYHLLFALNTPITLVPNIVRKPTYDVEKDLIAVAHVAATPLVLYVNADVPVTNFGEFVELAKRRKGAISYGFPGTGSAFHLLGEYVSKQLGLELVAVPYKGAAPMLNDLVGGQIEAGINDIGVTAQFVKSGKLRALAATGSERSRAAPNIPTFRELGVVGAEQFSPWWGVYAPAGTPSAIVARLSAEIVRILKTPQVAARLLESGYEVTALPSQQATLAVSKELGRWRSVLADLGNPKFD